MWASDLHMDFVLQRRFALDAKVPGDLRDQLSLLPVREDAIDVLTGNSSHGGKVGFPEVLSDYDGVVYVPMDAPGVDWRLKMAREIEDVGIEVDLRKLR